MLLRVVVASVHILVVTELLRDGAVSHLLALGIEPVVLS